MSFVNTIRQWDEGVAFADTRDWATALRVLLDIEEMNSKIYFNIGCIRLINKELDDAEKAFDNSICKDEHLAVAFFQRGITFYKKLKFEESLGDFQKTFTELRGNQLIDYKPLGLRYKLYACEVLHNIALAQAQLGKWEKAQESLLSALSLKTESKHGHIDKALESVLKQKLFEPVEIRAGVLFRPNKNYVAELEKKDYLGKAKVVASIIPEDDFSGFAPLQPQVEEEVPTKQKIPEVLRALEGEPHSVLYEFIAETAEELTVLPGNIVFVLQKGADNWASVIFNGKTGLVPYNFLEPVEITLSSKQELQEAPNNDIPAPPRGKPPSRPGNRAALEPSPKANAVKTSDEDDMIESQMCILKVQFGYTVAIHTAMGLSYSTVLDRISKKLNLPLDTIILSYKKTASHRVNVDELEMDNIWRSAQNGRLTLWCDVKDKENRPFFVARHTYEATQPEDLEFCQGDVITVLSKVNEQWLEGQCKGKVGIFPACFVDQSMSQQRN
ncbi:neutrophil cytosol factor 2 isoform X1 [Anguilla rostrata]|uniref:neutrophil cytosol factor 2 isoform X1 n=1 Tax=Anguilla rostrata TaxID=7938 RepID=UPI0030D45052